MSLTTTVRRLIVVAAIGACPVEPLSAQANPPGFYPPTQNQSSPATPAAADQTLGVAQMSAIVTHVGALLGGSGATSATRGATGSYSVTFERSVTGCAFYASGGQAIQNDLIYAVVASPYYSTVSASTVGVLTKNPTNFSASDAAFHLLVFCHK